GGLPDTPAPPAAIGQGTADFRTFANNTGPQLPATAGPETGRPRRRDPRCDGNCPDYRVCDPGPDAPAAGDPGRPQGTAGRSPGGEPGRLHRLIVRSAGMHARFDSICWGQRV